MESGRAGEASGGEGGWPRGVWARDWHLWMGASLTVGWLLLGLLYVFWFLGFGRFVGQDADKIGGFLEGAFAPLAFLWLVIGFFLQQRELRANNQAIRQQYNELRRTAENAEVQARAIAASELHARQETFMKLVGVINIQLGEICGMIYLSKEGPTFGGELTQEGVHDLWSQFATHPEVFIRRLLGIHFSGQPDEIRDYLLGTEIRRRHTENFVSTFERMLEAGSRCDPEGFLRSALRGSAQGTFYRIAQEYRAREDGGGVTQSDRHERGSS